MKIDPIGDADAGAVFHGAGDPFSSIRHHNWTQTPLGDFDAWPANLKSALGFVLHAGSPLLLFWGRDLLCFFNEAYRQLVKPVNAEAALGRPLRDADPGSFSILQPLLLEVMNGGGPRTSGHLLLPFGALGNGQSSTFSLVLNPVAGPQGEVHGIWAICNPVNTASSFGNIVEGASSPIMVFKGEELVVTEANQATLDLWQVERSAIGRPFLEIMPEFSDQVFPKLIRQVMHTGVPYKGFEYPALFRRDGGSLETYYFNFEYVPYREADGSVSGVVIWATDVTGQVTAKKKLDLAEGEMRMAIRAAELGYWDLNPQTNTFSCNEKTRELFGLPASEDVDLALAIDHIHPDDRAHVIASIDAALRFENGGRYETECRVILPDRGNLLHLRSNGQAYRNAAGELVRFSGTVQDFTQQKLAEAALRESEERFRTIADYAPAYLFLVGADARVEYMNKTWLQDAGLTTESAIGHGWMRIIHPDDLSRLLQLYGDAFARQEAATFQVRQKDRTGAYRTIYWKAVPRFRGAEYAGLMGIGYDITDQIAAQEALEAQTRFTESIIESTPSLIYIYDLELDRNVFASPQIFRILGYTSDEAQALGSQFLPTVFHPEDVVVAQTNLAHLKAGQGDEIFDMEYRMRHKAGHWVWLFDRTRVFRRDVQGRAVQILGVATDITARRELQQKLAKQFDELQLVYNTAPVGLALIDPELRFVRINQRLAEINGVSVAEHLGRTIHEVVPDIAPQVEAIFHRIFRTGEPLMNVEVRGETKARPGVERIWNESWYPIKNDAGETVAVSVVAEEITERKRAEEALQERESRLQKLVQSNIVGVLFWDLDLGIVDANDAFLTMLGYTRDDLQRGLHWDGITPAHWAERDAQSIQELLTNGRYMPFEKQYIHKDGRLVDVIIASTAFEGTGNRRGVTYVLDITDRKKAEEALRESEQRFRSIADDAPAFIFMGNADAEIEFINDTWIAFTGLPKGEALGQGWASVTHPDDLQRSFDIYNEAFHARTHYQYEMQQRGADGTYHWILWRGIPRFLPNGEFLGILGFGFDITEMKNAEAALKESEERYRSLAANLERIVAERTNELQRSNEDLQQFAHVASHDLKEPVRKVLTFANRLHSELDQVVSERAKVFLEKIEAAAKRSYDMIEGVLRYSSIGEASQQREPVNLNEVMAHIEADLEVPIAANAVQIEYGELPVVSGHSELLYQLFYNLLVNALKFRRPGVTPNIRIGWRTVRLADEGPGKAYTEIWVKDNGIGFDPAYAETIFQTFSRLNPKDKYEGSGLGLALCKKIAERHGGFIRAEGAEGEGATFRVFLPEAGER